MVEKKPKILAVEDNPGVLFNLKMTLEYNNFDVITAPNGEEAIDALSKMKDIPDLIISDIMMPKMDGYDFFKAVSENSDWGLIPFLFLTAKSSPEDVRFGKILGVDDYITKPFEEENLLAIIKGKIARHAKIKQFQEKFEVQTTSVVDTSPSIKEFQIDSVFLFLMVWDEIMGPELKEVYPTEIKAEYTLKEIGIQLFQSAVSIYGQSGFFEAKGILLDVLRNSKFKKTAYIYFDSVSDPNARGNMATFMLVTLAPKISYFHSLKLGELFKKISERVKDFQEWNKKFYFKQIIDILTT